MSERSIRWLLFALLVVCAPTLVFVPVAVGMFLLPFIGVIPLGALLVWGAGGLWALARQGAQHSSDVTLFVLYVLAWGWAWWALAKGVTRRIFRAPPVRRRQLVLVTSVLILALSAMPIYGWTGAEPGQWSSAYHA